MNAAKDIIKSAAETNKVELSAPLVANLETWQDGQMVKGKDNYLRNSLKLSFCSTGFVFRGGRN
jgi:hypothetical protein